MGIADRKAGGNIGNLSKHHGLVYHLSPLPGHRDFVAPESRLSHGNLHPGALLVQIVYRHLASQGIPGNLRLLDVAGVLQISGKNPHAVSALLRLASVWIQDSHIHLLPSQHGTYQNSV